MRFFLERSLIAGDEPLTDDQTGITICVPLHPAVRAAYQGCARGIAFCSLPSIVANHETMTAVTFPARIGRVDSAGNDPDVPRLVFGVIEDTSLHPVGAFAVSPATILALLRLEVAQVLKDEDARLMSLGELDNTGAHQTSADSVERGLGAALHAKLREDSAHMRLDGLLGI